MSLPSQSSDDEFLGVNLVIIEKMSSGIAMSDMVQNNWAIAQIIDRYTW